MEEGISPIAWEVDPIIMQASAEDGANFAWMVLMDEGQITG